MLTVLYGNFIVLRSTKHTHTHTHKKKKTTKTLLTVPLPLRGKSEWTRWLDSCTNLEVEGQLIDGDGVFTSVVLHHARQEGLGEEKPRHPELVWFAVVVPLLERANRNRLNKLDKHQCKTELCICQCRYKTLIIHFTHNYMHAQTHIQTTHIHTHTNHTHTHKPNTHTHHIHTTTHTHPLHTHQHTTYTHAALHTCTPRQTHHIHMNTHTPPLFFLIVSLSWGDSVLLTAEIQENLSSVPRSSCLPPPTLLTGC